MFWTMTENSKLPGELHHLHQPLIILLQLRVGGRPFSARCDRFGRSREEEESGRHEANSGWVSMNPNSYSRQKLLSFSDEIISSTILVGGDQDTSTTPAWAKDGSFMVYRIYEQRVPEFIS